MGVKVRAVKREASKVAVMTNPNCLNTIPVIPVTNIKGTNTTMVVKVEAEMAMPISEVP